MMSSTQTKEKREPVRQSVLVDLPAEDAFRLFTEGFSQWWPLALYSVNGPGDATRCELEPWPGGRVFERTSSGQECDWGSVDAWEPPSHLRLHWHPGGQDSAGQTVDVEFATERSGGTRVTVTHTGWETPGVAVCSLTRRSGSLWSSTLLHQFAECAGQQMLVLA